MCKNVNIFLVRNLFKRLNGEFSKEEIRNYAISSIEHTLDELGYNITLTTFNHGNYQLSPSLSVVHNELKTIVRSMTLGKSTDMRVTMQYDISKEIIQVIFDN